VNIEMLGILTDYDKSSTELFELEKPLELPLPAINLIYLLDLVEDIDVTKIILAGLRHYAKEIINDKHQLYTEYIQDRFNQSLQTLLEIKKSS